jgi:hypothetical protein
MIYKVKARVIEETIGEFYRKLADGTVSKQRPDGEEIVASMKRAVLTRPGVAEWYEMCFCPTPLDHERRTQYDFYFTDMTTEPAEARGEIQGASLCHTWLRRLRQPQTLNSVQIFYVRFVETFISDSFSKRLNAFLGDQSSLPAVQRSIWPIAGFRDFISHL